MLTGLEQWFDAYSLTILNGFAIGLLLFITALGLSLVFGSMDILNLAHGALFLLGAYIAFSLMSGHPDLQHFLLAGVAAVAIGLAAGGGLSAATQRLVTKGHLPAGLFTFGIALAAADVMAINWGSQVHTISPPDFLAGSVLVFGHLYPSYRLALILVGALIAIAIYVGFERTRMGALVRAAVYDREMLSALGVNTFWLTTGVFAAGAALSALGGVIGAPLFGAQPGLDDVILLLAMVVIVIGGLGSLPGALVGALLVGQVRSLGVALLPGYSSFLVFAAMTLVLILRPSGLFGRER